MAKLEARGPVVAEHPFGARVEVSYDEFSLTLVIELRFCHPDGRWYSGGCMPAILMLTGRAGVGRFRHSKATREHIRHLEVCLTDELRMWARLGGLPILAGTHPQVPAFEAAVAAGADPAEAARQILEFDVDGEP